MGGILFLYNIILISICAAACTTAALTYRKTRCHFYLYLALLPICFIVELIVLQYICSGIYFSGQPVDAETINHISFKLVRIVTYLLILLLDFLILLWITKISWNTKFLLLFLPALIFYVILAFPEQTNLVVWLFYSIRQFYRFGFLLFFVYRYVTTESEQLKQRLSHFVVPLTGVFFLNCSILIEDSLMISHLSPVLFDSPWMSERNFSENFLWAFLCWCIIYVCSQRLFDRIPAQDTLPKSTEQEQSPVSLEENPSQDEANADSAAGPLLKNLPAFAEYYKLTPREIEILRCLIQCQHTSEICDELNISVGTVKTHIHNIYMKLEINTRAELIRELSEFNKS